jgi:hypothetical protein
MLIAMTLPQAAAHLNRPIEEVMGWAAGGYLITVQSPIDGREYVDVAHLVEVEFAWYSHEMDPAAPAPRVVDAERTDPAPWPVVASWLLSRHGIDLGTSPKTLLTTWAHRDPTLRVEVDGSMMAYDRQAVLRYALRVGR